jgi:glycosyltransferase involved in cell wall biosynthesis
LKRVIHLITTIERGGAENQLLTLVTEQQKLGFEVSVFPLKGKTELMKDFASIGARVDLQLIGLRFFQQLYSLKRLISNDNAIIHAHLPRAELLGALAHGTNELIISRHNAEPFFPNAPKWLSRTLSKFVTRKSKAVIAISHAVARFMMDSSEISAVEKLHVVLYGQKQTEHSPGSKDHFSVVQSYRHGLGPVIGTIGRLTAQKDYPTLLHAFQIFSMNHPQATLIILGEGNELENLEAESKKLKISDRVFFLGKKSNIEEYLNQMDLFILASKYEGFGLVLLEAMGSNIPIVASNNSAIPEVIGPEHPGLAITGNACDFANKMALLLDGPTKEIALQLQSHQLSLFDPVKMAKKVFEIYLL